MKAFVLTVLAMIGGAVLAPFGALANEATPAAGQWVSFRIPAARNAPAPAGSTVRSRAPVYAFKLVIPTHQVVNGKKWVLESEIQAMPDSYPIEVTQFAPDSWADDKAFPSVTGGGFTQRRAGGARTWSMTVGGPEVHIVIGNKQGQPPASEVRGRLRWTIQDEAPR